MATSADITKAKDEYAATDETTPLLAASAATDQPGSTGTAVNGTPIATSEPSVPTQDENPLPVGQILLLCFVSLVEPVSYFAIFPIVSDMLVKTGGLDVKDIPIWSGLIEALFSIVQMSVMIQYGKLADRIGRRPILAFSLFGIAAGSALFGLSRTLWQMVLFRAITGLFAGSAVTIRAMLSDVTNKKTQATAFGWYASAKNLGIFVGPLIGGTLADPVKNIPFFKDSAFFREFPYALSMFTAAGFCLISAIVAMLGAKETLIVKAKDDQSPSEAPMTAREVLKAPGVAMVVYLYGHVAFLALTYTAVNPVWSYEPIDLGGLGFAPVQISYFVALAGASQAFWMLLPFPFLQRRIGTGPLFRACTSVWPFFMAGGILLNELRRWGRDDIFWIFMPIETFLGSGVAMAFACTQLCVNDVAPTPQTLGLLNAIALTVNSGIRAFAPILGNLLYEFGEKGGWIDGHLIWVFLTLVGVGLWVATQYIPPNAEGRPEKKIQDQERT